MLYIADITPDAMQLRFSYDAEKDVENIIRASRSVNSPRPTPFQLLATEGCGGELHPDRLHAFLAQYDEEHRVDREGAVDDAARRWKRVGEAFIARAETLFGMRYPEPFVTAFLTHNERCTYSIEQGYFFVTLGSERSHCTAMHELLHFYTWHAFEKQLREEGLSPADYNDLKESLTELLNGLFADLMGEFTDKGYPQHAALREIVRNQWAEGRALAEIVTALAEEIRNTTTKEA